MSPPPGWSVRRAAAADLDAVMAIERASFPPGVAEGRDTFRDRVETFPEGFLLLAPPGGAPPAAYVCSEIQAAGDGYGPERFRLGHAMAERHRPDGTTLYVSSMGLLPAWRGRGLGGLLFGALLDALVPAYPRLDGALLIVGESWAAARAIYRRAGFAERGLLPGFLRPDGAAPIGAVVMAKGFGGEKNHSGRS